MRRAWTELQAFGRAAVVVPVPRDHTESDAAFTRRRWVSGVTLVAGTGVLAWALRIPPGDDTFYLATGLLAAVWVVGAVASGPLHLGYAHTRDGGLARPVAQSVALGGGILLTFLLGGLAVAQLPVLREPVQDLLDHARLGSLALIALLTAVNGIAEELYFRGGLFAAVGRRHAVLVTTVLYSLTTVGTGVPLLVFAAACLGLLTGLQRRVTGGVLGPIITHLIWSLGMLFALPAVLSLEG